MFNGREYDADTGLYYYRTRYMDPKLGRFIARDTIGLWGDENNLGNPYTYVGNNPWSRLDPFGEYGNIFYGESGQDYLRQMGNEYGKMWNTAFQPAIKYWKSLDSETQYRVLGTVQLVGSGLEAGGGLVGLIVTSPTGVGVVVNGALVVHGADGVQAAIRQIASGQSAGTATEYVITATTGSRTAGALGDTAIGFVNPVRGITKAGVLIAADTGADVVGGFSRGARAGSGAAEALGTWQRVSEGMSQRARAYQAQITGRVDEAFIVDGVKFDGVDGDVLLDAKGPGYESFVKNGEFQQFFDGADQFLDQARRQLEVARGNRIEWHVAEESTANAIRTLLGDSGFTNIVVYHTPDLF